MQGQAKNRLIRIFLQSKHREITFRLANKNAANQRIIDESKHKIDERHKTEGENSYKTLDLEPLSYRSTAKTGCSSYNIGVVILEKLQSAS